MKAFRLSPGEGPAADLNGYLARCLSEGILDAVMVPVKGPGGRSWPWMLVTDPSKLAEAVPLPLVMQVQGAQALRSIADALGDMRIGAVLRPCEYRSAVELTRLQQLDLDSILVLGIDCSGSGKLIDLRDLDAGAEPGLRPVCEMCTGFTGEGDIRVAMREDGVLLAPLSDAGKEHLVSSEPGAEEEFPDTDPGEESRRHGALTRREEEFETLAREAGGLDGLVSLFSGCIGCRNCRDVCPVCYCRLCFIDTKDQRLTSSQHMSRSGSSGSARFPPGTLLFHIGRMAHMSLSCTSCGMCEDACPGEIPIARLMSMVSAGTGRLFDYEPGEISTAAAPLNTYLEDELHEFED